MTKETKRLLNLIGQMNEKAEEPAPEPNVEASNIGERQAPAMRRRGRPPKIQPGDKSQYMKMTITVSPEAYDLLITEVARRKRARAKEPTISAIIREMTMKYLAGLRDEE